MKISSYFSDIFGILKEKNKEILDVVAKYDKELADLKQDVLSQNQKQTDESDINNKSQNQERNSNSDSKNTNKKESNDENKTHEKSDNQEGKPNIFGATALSYGVALGTYGTTRLTTNLIQKSKINKQLEALKLNNIEKQKEAINDIVEQLEARKNRS
ncbi:MAG: hypothetical protein GXP45_05650 [bacterium]|nr:hypothetical protein [bacterium]